METEYHEYHEGVSADMTSRITQPSCSTCKLQHQRTQHNTTYNMITYTRKQVLIQCQNLRLKADI